MELILLLSMTRVYLVYVSVCDIRLARPFVQQQGAKKGGGPIQDLAPC